MFKPGFYTRTNYTFEQSNILNHLGIVVQTLGPMLRLWRSRRYGLQLTPLGVVSYECKSNSQKYHLYFCLFDVHSQHTPLRVLSCDCRSNLQKYHFHIHLGCASGDMGVTLQFVVCDCRSNSHWTCPISDWSYEKTSISLAAAPRGIWKLFHNGNLISGLPHAPP